MLKRFVFVTLVLAACSGNALADTVRVTVNIGDPRYYGPIEPQGYPAPQLVYREPVIVYPVRGERLPPPVYIRVPVGEARHWERHCRKYHACDQPVYFVTDEWYLHEYAPRYVELHGKGKYKESKEEKHARKEAKKAAKEADKEAKKYAKEAEKESKRYAKEHKYD